MRSFLIYHVLTLLIACTLVFLLFTQTPALDFLLSKNTAGATIEDPKLTSGYYSNYKSGEQSLYDVCYALKNKSILLLGSSELTEETTTIPYRFIPTTLNYPVLGLGHAGNQSLCILTQLAAMEQYLDSSKIVIIVSPGWFSTEGTSMESFLEFNDSKFLYNVLSNENIPSDVKEHIYSYVHENFKDISSSDAILRLMSNKKMSSENIFKKIIYYPVIKTDELLLSANIKFQNKYLAKNNSELPFSLPQIHSDLHYPNTKDSIISWQLLFDDSKTIAAKNTTSNSWGIYDDIYKNDINGKHGRVKPVHIENNNELKNYTMLLRFLHFKNVNASFIIQPLNPYYYTNLTELDPLISKLDSMTNANGFNCLNLFSSDTSKYEKALLKDIMHSGDYGWYKMNQFIVAEQLNNGK